MTNTEAAHEIWSPSKAKGPPAFSWRWPKLGLFVPSGRNIPTECARSLRKLQMVHQMPELNIGRHCLLDKVRTMACTALMESDLDALVMLDDDHLHPPDIINRLAFWLAYYRGSDTPVDVVGGLNFRRFGNHAPCVFNDIDGEPRWDGTAKPTTIGAVLAWTPGKLHPAAILGTGSIMITKQALEKLDYPYFAAPISWVKTPADAHGWPGEDIGFAANCRRNGVQQYFDPACISPHLSEFYADDSHFDRDGQNT